MLSVYPKQNTGWKPLTLELRATSMREHMPCRSNVDCECAGWPVSPIEHAQLCGRGQGLKRSGGSEHWPSGPWGGWFPHWVSLFLANNRDLIWLGWGGGEGVSKASVTPLLHSHRFPLCSLKGVISLFNASLCNCSGQLRSRDTSLTRSEEENNFIGVLVSRTLESLHWICLTFDFLVVNCRSVYFATTLICSTVI